MVQKIFGMGILLLYIIYYMCSKKGSCVVKKLTNVIYFNRTSLPDGVKACLKDKNKLTPGDTIIFLVILYSDANYVNPIGTMRTRATVLCVNPTNIGCSFSSTRELVFDDNGPNGAGTIVAINKSVSPDITVIDGVIQPFSHPPDDIYVVSGCKNYVGGSGIINQAKNNNLGLGILSFDMTVIQCKEC
jgi:hypothetical protein